MNIMTMLNSNHDMLALYCVVLDLPFQRGDRLYTSESDVCRRQIMTYKDGLHTERIKTFITAVDPWHRYSNEAERVN